MRMIRGPAGALFACMLSNARVFAMASRGEELAAAVEGFFDAVPAGRCRR